MLRLLTFILMISVLVSCAGRKKETEVTTLIHISGKIAGDGGMTGGVMIWGRNLTTGDHFSYHFDGQPIVLPNGVWDFKAIGWDGYYSGSHGYQMVGDVNCGVLHNIILEGDEVGLNLVLSTGGCHGPEFGPSAYKEASGAFRLTDIHSCFKEEAIVLQEPVFCNQSAGRSYRITLPEFFSGQYISDGLVSDCISTGGSNPAMGNVRAPFFTDGGPFIPAGVIVYENPGCAGDNIHYPIDMGLYHGIPAVTGTKANGSSNDFLIKTNPCDFDIGNQTTPFIVDMTPQLSATTKIICSLNQFGHIAGNLADTYMLNNNLDFTPISPVAGPLIPGTFTGTFYGNDKWLYNLTINDNTGSHDKGMFSQVNGAYISNFNINGFQYNITDSSNVGILVGSINDGPSATEIRDILIEDSNISLGPNGGPRDSVGGIVGRANAGTGATTEIGHVVVKNVDIAVADDHSNIGGIVGQMQDSASQLVALRGALVEYVDIYMNETFTSGNTIGGVAGRISGLNGGGVEIYGVTVYNLDIGTPGTRMGHQYIGGIIGDSVGNGSNSRLLVNSAQSGYIYSSSDTVGGIAGRISSVDIMEAISKLTLDSNSATGQVGGIVGHMQPDQNGHTVILQSAISNGNIYCQSRCGGIAGSVGVAIVPGGATTALIDQVAHLGTIHHNSSGGNVGGGSIVGEANTLTDNVNMNINIQKAYASGLINANGNRFGGVVGIMSGNNTIININDTYVDATIDDLGSADVLGGIAGQNDNSAVVTNKVVVNADLPTVTNRGPCNGAESNAYGGVNNTTHLTGFALNGSGTNCGMANHATLNMATISGPLTLAATDWSDNPSTLVVNPKWFVDFSSVTIDHIGSMTDPILLYGRDQWNAIGDKPLFMKKNFRLEADIDMSAGGSVPTNNFNMIGSITNTFNGQFQGNNFGIYNAHISDSSGDPVGLFSRLGSDTQGGARIGQENLFDHDEIFTFRIVDGFFAGSDSVGALAGDALDSGTSNHEAIEIEGVHVINTTVTHTGAPGATSPIGGAIGEMQVNNPNTELFDMYFDGTVTTGDTLTGASVGVGGIVGFVGGAAAGGFDFDYVVNYGFINAPNVENVGGLVGLSTNNDFGCKACLNFGDVVGDSDVGGLVGHLAGSIVESANRGDVTANTGVAGGLVGLLAANTNLDVSYNLGDVSSPAAAGGIYGDDGAVGSETVTACFSDAINVTGSPGNYFYGSEGGGGTYSGNFYTGPDQSIPAQATNVTLSGLMNPGVVSALNSGTGGYILNFNQLPVLWFELFPEFLFED